jgi:hypothetical protein
MYVLLLFKIQFDNPVLLLFQLFELNSSQSSLCQVASSDGDLRMLRATCYERTGQIGEAVGDLT